MREGFEDHLNTYHKTAKELREAGIYEGKDVFSEADVAEMIDAAAGAFQSTRLAEEHIFAIQMIKAEVMDHLHQTLADIEKGKGVISGDDAYQLQFSANDGTLDVEIGGKTIPVSVSELLTDGEWGVEYALPKEAPRQLRRRFALSCAKRELQNLLDQQIVEDEVGHKNRRSGKSHGGSIFHRMQEGTFQEGIGNIAEKMVRNFLTKATMDLDLDIAIIKADLYQDTIEKIDFVIRRKSRNRGVEVSQSEGVDIGIQFTTNTSPEGQQHKMEQLQAAREHAKETKEVDDVVLVTMPLQHTGALFAKWAQNRMPGGPEKLWDATVKEKVLRGVLEGILSIEEIDAAVAKLS